MGQSKHTPPVSTGGVYYDPMSETTETEPVTGYGYLTKTEAAAAIAAHKAAVAKNSKAR